MGRVVSALMFGIIPDEDLAQKLITSDGEPVWDGRQPTGDRTPRWSEDGRCLGYCFAVSRSPDQKVGEVDLDDYSVRMSDIASTFGEPIGIAAKRWDRFVSWVEEQFGIVLPGGEFLLTSVERA